MLTEDSFGHLLAVVKVIYYLYKMPTFLKEINSIGSIPVTVFLENLLVKTTMTGLKNSQNFKNWVITLLFKFKKVLPDLDLSKISGLKKNQYQIYDAWSEEVIIPFVIEELSGAVRRRDVGLVAVLVHFLRIFMLFMSSEKLLLIRGEGLGS